MTKKSFNNTPYRKPIQNKKRTCFNKMSYKPNKVLLYLLSQSQKNICSSCYALQSSLLKVLQNLQENTCIGVTF